ncbi:DNA polymerase [Brevundimonas sp. Leaf363]|uniref:UdgX family uracil-DNA binding protein n=1 Tax=Brevundimonas sp. Leaf363 TaxID=1736353 RepID=UPI0006FDC2B4|nr:UdgX family uracil-DNA binding protein [Brevundimonas sp. Leaf363]KQS55772.1 DNA polymerase [Brevundimonas sp. Leaf363]
MRVVTLQSEIDFDGWRKAARDFRLAGVEPGSARFRVAGADQQTGLFDTPAHPGFRGDERKKEESFSVPKPFVDLAEGVILHRSDDRFDLMYRLLWRLRDEPNLIKVTSDIDVADALERAKNVSRASHKMKAFVRFREVEDDQGQAWVAWFEPAHRVVERTAPFFMRRFTTMRWAILTPDGSAAWDGHDLAFGPPATRDMAPQDDEIEEFWKTYYASTFNPARLRTKAMQGEMAKRYWANLPEASLIPELIAASAVRTETMVAAPAPAPNERFARVVPAARTLVEDAAPPLDLAVLNKGVQACRRCPLWRDATQGVCGEGPRQAKLMIVGEQPGDHEDLSGQPFVGPAGQVLDAALAEAGIDRSDVYVTNAVKHFKHEPRGKRRLHKTPDTPEIVACRWWLDNERRLVKPQVVVALGATAGLSLLHRRPAVTKERGQPMPLDDGSTAILTVHPSYLLRIPDEDGRARERAALVRDLRAVRERLA